MRIKHFCASNTGQNLGQYESHPYTVVPRTTSTLYEVNTGKFVQRWELINVIRGSFASYNVDIWTLYEATLYEASLVQRWSTLYKASLCFVQRWSMLYEALCFIQRWRQPLYEAYASYNVEDHRCTKLASYNVHQRSMRQRCKRQRCTKPPSTLYEATLYEATLYEAGFVGFVQRCQCCTRYYCIYGKA